MSTPDLAQTPEGEHAHASATQHAHPPTAIFAGNSRAQVGDDGSVRVEPQLQAFKAALKLAQDTQSNHGIRPRISIAFDHQGVFRLQFLAEGLTNSQKRNPRLAHLDRRIVAVFAAAAEEHGVPLEEIRVIHEDSARQHALHVISADHHPEALLRRMVSQSSSDGKPHGTGCSGKLTCAVITKEYFEKAAGESHSSSSLLEVFFEDSPWSRDLAYVRGLQLSHLLGVRAAIRLNLVDQDGNVTRGQVIEGTQGANNA